MSVSVKVEKLVEAQVSLDVSVSKDNVSKGFDRAYKEIGSKVSIPGFRPGKAPKHILRQRYEFSLKKEALENIVSDSVKLISEKENINFISSLEIESLSTLFEVMTEGEPLVFKAKAEVYPEAEVSSYKAIKVAVPKYVFTDEHVADKLKEMQHRLADSKEKEADDATVGEGDIVKLQIRFFSASAELEDTHSEHNLNMKEKDIAFDKIKKELIGMKKGAEKEFLMQDIGDIDKAIKDKYDKFTLKIGEIREQFVPEIDDELAKDNNFDNLEAFKEDIEKTLRQSCEQKKKDKAFNEISSKIIGNSTFSIGKQALENQVNNYVKGLTDNLRQYNMAIEDYLMSAKKTLAEIKDSYKEQAEKDIKFELIKDFIIKKEKFDIKESDINNYCKEYATYYNISEEEARSRIDSNKSGADSMLVYKKFVDFMLDNNIIEEEKEESIYEIKDKASAKEGA